MGKTHKVHFEPVGIEIEVEEEETVLDAAFRQGVMLMHGCRQGQCAACKAFLLDGDMEMDPFSTFALNETEEEEGFVLLCKSYAYGDLEVELIAYHEDMLETGVPIQMVHAEVQEIEDLTHDIKRLVLNLVDPPR
jgi:propane monooxygenase reductase subunit